MGSQIGRPKKSQLFKYPRLPATIVGYHTKVVTFVGPRKWLFCWPNYVIFQGITTVYKPFRSLIQKMFEAGPHK